MITNKPGIFFRFLTSGLLAVLAAVMGSCAFAAEDAAEAAVTDATGSVSVTLYSEDEDARMTDGALGIYRVAGLAPADDGYAYALTPEFEGCGYDPGSGSSRMAAEEAAAWAESREIACTGLQDVGRDGTVLFTDLEPGIYLIVQAESSAGFYDIAPFLVSIPTQTESGPVYDLAASPKVNPEPAAGGTAGETGDVDPGSSPLPAGEPDSAGDPDPEPSPSPEIPVTDTDDTAPAGTSAGTTEGSVPQTGDNTRVVAVMALLLALIAALAAAVAVLYIRKRHGEDGGAAAGEDGKDGSSRNP